MAKYYDRGWNPILGCKGCFDGCELCFAKELMQKRNLDKSFKFDEVKINRNQLHKVFDKKPQLIAVCTQSDLFQDDIQEKFIDGIMRKCNNAKQHRFLFLTKYIDNLLHYFNTPNRMKILNNNHLVKFSFENMIFGVTVCTKNDLHRIDKLKSIKNIKHRFVSFEPLMENLEIDVNTLKDIDWIIVGAATGGENKFCDIQWIIDIVEKANHLHIPVFVNSIHLEGGKITSEFDEMPNILRQNENPFLF